MQALHPCALVGGAALIDYREGVVLYRQEGEGGRFEQTKRTTPGSATDCLSSLSATRVANHSVVETTNLFLQWAVWSRR